jgi:hypothetical protein
MITAVDNSMLLDVLGADIRFGPVPKDLLQRANTQRSAMARR